MLSLFRHSEANSQTDPYFLRDKVIYIDLDNELHNEAPAQPAQQCPAPTTWLRQLTAIIHDLADRVETLRLYVTGSTQQ